MCAQKSIDISTKLKILEEVEIGAFSKTKIAERYKIAKSTLSTIIKNKEKIDAAVAAGSSGSIKRIRKASHEDIENELLTWFKRARNSNVSISGPLMKEKAKEISVSMGIDNFQCSDGWLWRFQKRYKISSHIVSGEANKVNENDITEWLKYFYDIRRSYDEKDIFNLDETGVFYNMLPDRSLDFKNVKCHGGSKSKERLTVVLCCNANGSEKFKLWIIGKYKNPRCLNKINRLILSFDYTHQKNAWVDSVSFRLWLIKFQRKMAREDRHVLLTLDNCSAHNIDGLDLPNVKIIFFPANSTSRVQPLDQGIIAAFKSRFKTRLVRYALLCIESQQSNMKWNILQAMRAMAISWDDVTCQTITNCFNKAWNITTINSPSESSSLSQDTEDWTHLISGIYPTINMSFSEFIVLDNNVEICALKVNVEVEGEKKEDEVDNEEMIEKPSRNEILEALQTLQRFAQTTGELSVNFEDNLDKVRRECLKNCMTIYNQQRITDFLTPPTEH